jgi:hypothetical protein
MWSALLYPRLRDMEARTILQLHDDIAPGSKPDNTADKHHNWVGRGIGKSWRDSGYDHIQGLLRDCITAYHSGRLNVDSDAD